MTSESKIEREGCQLADSLEIWQRKFNSVLHIGLPDRVHGYKGRVWFIEYKKTGAVASKAQLREHRRMRKRGLDVYVCDSYHKVRRVLNYYTHGGEKPIDLLSPADFAFPPLPDSRS